MHANFLFDFYAYAYVASVSMTAGQRDVTNKKKKIFLTGTTRNRAQAYEVEETKIGGACGYLSV
ncbi:hypothetical protein T4E_184 [Trichinella pseudospiralis]|uniref:Uncharacterized protein n=1 Tax=Trichinella pseudospiralis TaxID=6337 RepID=A0A0V0XSP9_TRIPS|nr:hypothetical protein T4E_184 [Trichinella pseudospiralis]